MPLIPHEERLSVKQLIESGLDENIALVWQICLGKGMRYWQIFSLIGYWFPVQRNCLSADTEATEDILWRTQITLMTVELREYSVSRAYYLYYLQIGDQALEIIKSFNGKTREASSLAEIRSSLVRVMYQQQLQLEALCYEKFS